MKLLLDSHIFLALLDEGAVKLASEMKDAINAALPDVFLSTVSLWEVKIKFQAGRLDLSVPPSEFPNACQILGLKLLPIEPLHVLADLAVAPPTRDPFDRLLLAQAQCEQMRLVTIDGALAGHPLAWSAGR